MCKQIENEDSITPKVQASDVVIPTKKRRRRRRKTPYDGEKGCSSDSTGKSNTPHNKQRKPRRNRRRRRNGNKTLAKDEMSEEEKSLYLALDCEMVGTGPGGYSSALARVCIIDWYGDIVLDTYVKVYEPVTDYRTFVSGIRKEHLESDDAMEISECRALVASLIEGKIVIGHALINDFRALRLSHPWYDTRDTAKYTPLMKLCDRTGCMKARRLKDLVQEKLNRDIQCDGIEHCPYEDASAALALYKVMRKKWEKVMEYKFNKTKEITQQTTTSSSSSSELSAEDYENILEFFTSQ